MCATTAGVARACASGKRSSRIFHSKEVVGMPVRGVDGLERLAGGGDLVGQLFGLLDGQEGIDQHRVALAVDQRGRIGDPLQRLLAGRDVAVQAGTSGREHLVLQGGSRRRHPAAKEPRMAAASFITSRRFMSSLLIKLHM
jgi:hypothetical protein